MRILAIAVLILLTLELANAEPRHSERNRNYILRRQEAGLVSGTPTIRRIIGKREIDIYRTGLMFEGDHVSASASVDRSICPGKKSENARFVFNRVQIRRQLRFSKSKSSFVLFVLLLEDAHGTHGRGMSSR